MEKFDLTRTGLIGFVRTAGLTHSTPESERVAEYLDSIGENPECNLQGPAWKVVRASIYKIGPDQYRAYLA